MNGPRWVKSLIGDIAVFPSAVPEWSGLRDTPRERIAAAQRFAEFRAFECDLQALELEPGIERARLHRRQHAFRQLEA